MEEKLILLLKKLNEIVFVSEREYGGEVMLLDPKIEDREGTIYINAEFDREDFKQILNDLFSQRN